MEEVRNFYDVFRHPIAIGEFLNWPWNQWIGKNILCFMGPFVLLHISIGFRFVKPKWTGGVHNKGKFSCSISAIVMTKMIITESDSSIPYFLL